MVVIQSSVLFLSSVGDFNAAAHVSGAVGRGYAPDGFRSTGVGAVTPTWGVGRGAPRTRAAGDETRTYGASTKKNGRVAPAVRVRRIERSEETTSELQSLMRISYAVFCLKKKTKN